MTTTPSIDTELGIMRALADADREAAKRFAHWMRDYQGKRAQPKQAAQPQQPPQIEAPPEQPPQAGY